MMLINGRNYLMKGGVIMKKSSENKNSVEKKIPKILKRNSYDRINCIKCTVNHNCWTTVNKSTHFI